MRAFTFSLLGCLLTTAVVVVVVESFATPPAVLPLRNKHGGVVVAVALASSATDEASKKESSSSSASAAVAAETKLLKRERYIASNRFAVRKGKEARFEKRWANRKSRLAELDGFRYFHLMRRVTLGDGDDDGSAAVTYDGGTDGDSARGNYVSLTVWEDKNDFNAWRKGDAFREAHGGTSVGAFVSTMVSSIRVLRGAPKPAFYDGLLVQSLAPEFLPETVGGWRNVVFPEDGGTLPAECFVASNQFYVPRENAAAFERRWKNRESKLRFCEGFVSFAMMRRDFKTKTHGSDREADEDSEPTYVSFTIWKDRASFDRWRSGSAFRQVHGGKPAGDGGGGGDDDKKPEEPPKKPPQAPGPPLWSRPPKPVFYEGTLVITTADGA